MRKIRIFTLVEITSLLSDHDQSSITSPSPSDGKFESVTLSDNKIQAESSSLTISSLPLILDQTKPAPAASLVGPAPPVVSKVSSPSSSSAIYKIFSFKLFNFVFNFYRLNVAPFQLLNIFNIFGK